jgi:hypothetical protein
MWLYNIKKMRVWKHESMKIAAAGTSCSFLSHPQHTGVAICE